MKMKKSKKFSGLHEYFFENEKEEIELTFKEIERINGTKLSYSAYTYEAYWYGTKSHSLPRAWEYNGYTLMNLSLDDKKAVFKRKKDIIYENDIFENLKSTSGLDPYIYDPRYNLVDELVNAFTNISEELLDLADLKLLINIINIKYKSTWETVLESVELSNISSEDKLSLTNRIEKVSQDNESGSYSTLGFDESNNDADRTSSMGIWGISPHVTNKSAKTMLKIVLNLQNIDNENEMLNYVEREFKHQIAGIGVVIASNILHYVEPEVFPMLNSWQVHAMRALESEGVHLTKNMTLDSYIKNTRELKEFRDNKCQFKNYRVLDIEIKRVRERLNEIVESKEKGKSNDVTKIEQGNNISSLNKARLEIVISAIIELGGIAHLKDIFELVKKDPKYGLDKISSEENIEASIRRLIQLYSSDSVIYKEENKDLFYSVEGKGKGLWGLRESYGENMTVDFDLDIDLGSLYFEDVDFLKKQIQLALKSNKDIILIGPPGTGKSKIAKSIAESFGVEFKMVTAMSDWSSYDTIGGYKPNEDGSLYFEEGIFLSALKDNQKQIRNQWLIIDEINRADIDKAFGPFLSALSGDNVELSLKDSGGKNIELVLEENFEEDTKFFDNQYVISKDWRIIGTMNTFDKTSLYEMSYAFMRRFAFISVPIPRNIDATTVKSLCNIWSIDVNGEYDNVAVLWKLINEYKKVGPAIIEDIVRFISLGGDYISSVVLYILPQLEGLFDDRINHFFQELKVLDFIYVSDVSKDENIVRLMVSMEDFFNITISEE